MDESVSPMPESVVNKEHNCIRCSGVEISDSAICKLKKEKPVLKIPREHIRVIKICFDTPARNPFCRFFAGFIMLLLSVIGLTLCLLTWYAMPVMRPEGDILRVPLLPVLLWIMAGVGFWLLSGIFRARYHFMIETKRGEQKIFFEKAASRGDIDQFIRRARLRFGYEIDVSPLESKGLPD